MMELKNWINDEAVPKCELRTKQDELLAAALKEKVKRLCRF